MNSPAPVVKRRIRVPFAERFDLLLPLLRRRQKAAGAGEWVKLEGKPTAKTMELETPGMVWKGHTVSDVLLYGESQGVVERRGDRASFWRLKDPLSTTAPAAAKPDDTVSTRLKGRKPTAMLFNFKAANLVDPSGVAWEVVAPTKVWAAYLSSSKRASPQPLLQYFAERAVANRPLTRSELFNEDDPHFVPKVLNLHQSRGRKSTNVIETFIKENVLLRTDATQFVTDEAHAEYKLNLLWLRQKKAVTPPPALTEAAELAPLPSKIAIMVMVPIHDVIGALVTALKLPISAGAVVSLAPDGKMFIFSGAKP